MGKMFMVNYNDRNELIWVKIKYDQDYSITNYIFIY